jgi:hypothetical protein
MANMKEKGIIVSKREIFEGIGGKYHKGTLTRDILTFLSSSILNQYFFSVR